MSRTMTRLAGNRPGGMVARIWGRLTGGLMVLAISAGCAFTAGCAISPEQELQIGRDIHPQFEEEFGGRYPDPEVQQYVQGIGQEMARYAGRPQMDWEFHVLDSDQINAFAVPGGYVYITQGLLYTLQNEAQLAGILGHEAAHIAHRHSVQQLQRAQLIQAGALGAGLLLGSPEVADAAALVGGLMMMSYGRDQEREADLSGLSYMVQAGYNPEGLVETMQILQEAGGPGGPEFLSSHPNPENRIGYLRQRIDSRYPQAAETGRTGDQEFRRIVLEGRAEAAEPVHLLATHSWCGTCAAE